ncbi:MAG: glycosyltransferase, partial [Lachnospiraceae bacterium]|nr:glycosyltransferase [Lachnospiraceae bacterium]
MNETKPTYSCRITVMTPTYNRAGMIGELYGSLKRQTFRNFEWLVVDDGSTDQTQEIFEHWQKEEVS